MWVEQIRCTGQHDLFFLDNKCTRSPLSTRFDPCLLCCTRRRHTRHSNTFPFCRLYTLRSVEYYLFELSPTCCCDTMRRNRTPRACFAHTEMFQERIWEVYLEKEQVWGTVNYYGEKRWNKLPVRWPEMNLEIFHKWSIFPALYYIKPVKFSAPFPK